MGLRKFYEDYCAQVCGSLRPSERLCYKGICHLKNFMESTLLKMPQDTMGTISDALHLMRVEEELKSSHYGSALASLNIRGATCSIVLDSRHGLNPAKARTLRADETALITIYKIIFSAAHIQEVKMECRIEDQPEVVLTVDRRRAESLIGPEAMTAIKRNWNNIWDYLRPVVDQPELAAATKNYLSGVSDHNPIQRSGSKDETSWFKKVVPG